jgi:tRNA (guanine-N7-)-methyltransferase
MSHSSDLPSTALQPVDRKHPRDELTETSSADPCETGGGIGELDTALRRMDEAFAAQHGRPPSIADIQSDAAWAAMHAALKSLERAAASHRPGGCSYYIVRRRRFCANAAADGLGGVCSEHFAVGSGQEVLTKLPVEAFQGVGKRNLKRRMKRMTNPSAAQNLIPAPAVNWSAVFADPSLPLLLDIGCAKGRYVAQLAKSHAFAAEFGPHNFCGVEIFAPLVHAANFWRDGEGLRNLHYVACNINVSFESLAFPPTLSKVMIQFPDPWQEDNLAKRVLTPDLVAAIARALTEHRGELFIVSDVKFMAVDMFRTVMASGFFDLHPRHRAACAAHEPEIGLSESSAAEAAVLQLAMPVRPYCDIPTERDKVCDNMWRPIYRFLFLRKGSQ